jgi:hypothetical protein
MVGKKSKTPGQMEQIRYFAPQKHTNSLAAPGILYWKPTGAATRSHAISTANKG